MGIKRGRPQGPIKDQINIRLLPEYSSLLKNPSPIYWWMRRNNIRMPDIKKRGRTDAHNPSSAISRMLHDTMLNIIKEDPEAFLDFTRDHMVHAKWITIAFRHQQRTE